MIITGDGFDVSALVRAELDRHDWSGQRCGCGDSAEHVPLMFEAILRSKSPHDMIGYTLDDHVELGTSLFEVSVPAVEVILAALAGEVSSMARGHLLITLWRVSSGEAHATEITHERDHLGGECRARIREGLWVVAHIGMTGTADDAEMAADILEWSGLHEDRSSSHQGLLRRRALTKSKRRR